MESAYGCAPSPVGDEETASSASVGGEARLCRVGGGPGAAGVEDAAGDVDVAFGVAVEENLVAVENNGRNATSEVIAASAKDRAGFRASKDSSARRLLFRGVALSACLKGRAPDTNLPSLLNLTLGVKRRIGLFGHLVG